jgi:hypothetical protein
MILVNGIPLFKALLGFHISDASYPLARGSR